MSGRPKGNRGVWPLILAVAATLLSCTLRILVQLDAPIGRMTTMSFLVVAGLGCIPLWLLSLAGSLWSSRRPRTKPDYLLWAFLALLIAAMAFAVLINGISQAATSEGS